MAIDFILDNLAVGSYLDSIDPPKEFTALLCVAQEKDVEDKSRLWHKVPIIDMQPIPEEQLKEAVSWIRKAHEHGHRVLVFCNAGIGRSPSVIVAYLCSVLGYKFGQAVEYVAKRRPYTSMLPDLITTIDRISREGLP
jgi:protein-tyrosine phosphatase